MSNFGSKLAEILENRNLRAVEICRVTGLSEAMMSKWINGQQQFVAVSDLAKIATAISSNPKDQAELIKAHLLDEMPELASDYLEIKVRGTSYTLKDVGTPSKPLPPLKIQRALEILGREAIYDSDIRAVVLGLAKIVAPEIKEE